MQNHFLFKSVAAILQQRCENNHTAAQWLCSASAMEYKIMTIISADIVRKMPSSVKISRKSQTRCNAFYLVHLKLSKLQLSIFREHWWWKVTYQLPSQSLTLKSAFSSLALYWRHSRQRWFETIKHDQTISQLYTKPVRNKSTLYDALFPRLFPRHEEKQGHELFFDWEITGKLSNLATRWLQLRLDHQSNFLFCSSIYLSPMFCLRIHKKVVIGTQESWK